MDLQNARRAYQPQVPPLLQNLQKVHFEPAGSPKPLAKEIGSLFPKTANGLAYSLKKGEAKAAKALKIGVVFSGGQASGGHNVIGALFHAAKAIHHESQIFGFLGGPSGIVEGKVRMLEEKEIALFLNQGGFDLIGSGRTKIETSEQLDSTLKNVLHLQLDGLVIIGGDDSNTNAAVLAEYFLTKGCDCRVIGVPKTIDGDLQSADIPISFGFDSACKTYSEIIGNIARDALSARKYYHFIKLMGRSASHITLECAIATQPNLALIGEEKRSLATIVNDIADLICERQKIGKEYGVILIPEGLIEFIPEMAEENEFFKTLPENIQKQLLLDRDPHGNVTVSQIDTQVLLMDLVKKELKKRSFKGKFSAQDHFLGYEGRACFPSNFDANYCYALGLSAALAIRDRLTGVICTVQGLKEHKDKWTVKAVPIVSMMHMETRMGKQKPVIKKTIVDLSKPPYQKFAALRSSCRLGDHYRFPGPIQFFGPSEITDTVPMIL